MSEFDAMSAEDKAYLIQYWRSKDRMAAWENQKAEEKAKSPQVK